jgi:hypothetical protein
VIRVITEKIHEGLPGEGYAAGYEIESSNDGADAGPSTTVQGWYGTTREEALLRLLEHTAQAARSTAMALVDYDLAVAAIACEVAKERGLNMRGPQTVYEATGLFGASRIEGLEKRIAAEAKRVDDLHRCPHWRRYGEHCSYCPNETSIGGFLDLSVEEQRVVVNDYRMQQRREIAHEGRISTTPE